MKFKKGDKIIWDSGFGYEIGIFLADDKKIMGSYLVDLHTGVVRGKTYKPESEIKKSSTQLLFDLTNKYYKLE